MIAVAKFLSRLLAALSHRTLLRLGGGAGWILGRVVRHRRAQVLASLRRCFPEQDDAKLHAIADGMYRHLATVAFECLRFADRRGRAFPRLVDTVGGEHLDAALARGRGVLVLMGHIGNWELMGVPVVQRWSVVNVVVRALHNRRFDAYWRATREALGLRVLPPLHAYRDCLRALGRNEIVAILLDQNMRRKRGIFVDFFGQPACTTPGLAYLSAQAQVPVLPLFMIREPSGRHTLHILPPIDPPPDREPDTIRRATQGYTKVLEDIVRAHPSQWIWLHRRWRTQPEPDAASAPDVHEDGAELASTPRK